MKQSIKSIISVCLVAALGITGLAGSVLAATPSEQNVVTNPDNQDFTALNKHAVPTDYENIYRVQVRVEPPVVEAPPVYVALILDASNSMDNGGNDVWDAKTGTWIKRLDAVRQATQKALDTLYEESKKPLGPKNIYVNIISYWHGTTTLGTGIARHTTGFEPILDAQKKLLPKFENANGAGGVISSYTNVGGTEMYRGLQQLYTDMQATSMPSDSNRYVLLLTDGNEWDVDKTLTQKYAAALKAPLGQALPTKFSVPTKPTGNIRNLTSMPTGMGATIWSIVVGHGIDMRPRDWAAKWNSAYHLDTNFSGFSDPFGGGALIPNGFTVWDEWVFDGPSAADPLLRKVPPTGGLHVANSTTFQEDFGSAEMNMIMASIDIKNAYTTFPAITDVSDLGLVHQWYTNNGASTIENGKNAHYYFSMSLDGQNPVGFNDGDSIPMSAAPNIKAYAKYSYGHSTGLNGVFNDFAAAAANVKRTDVIVNDSLNLTAFDIYQMPGEPRIAVYSNDPVQPAMEIVESNGEIKWNMTELNPSYVYTLVYYIQLKPNLSAGADAYYPLELTPSYISYKNTQGTTTIKHFPVTQLQGGKWTGNAVESNVGGNVITAINQNGETIASSGNVLSAITNTSSIANLQGSGTSSTGSTGGGGIFGVGPMPYQASVANPNGTKANKKGAANNQTAQSTIESIDEAATKVEKNKKVTTMTSRTNVYNESKEDADVVLILNKGKTFKIVGVTSNYYMIQYKKKDGKVYKGYILKKDVKVSKA